jgi:hypothetical protein
LNPLILERALMLDSLVNIKKRSTSLERQDRSIKLMRQVQR